MLAIGANCMELVVSLQPLCSWKPSDSNRLLQALEIFIDREDEVTRIGKN